MLWKLIASLICKQIFVWHKFANGYSRTSAIESKDEISLILGQIYWIFRAESGYYVSLWMKQHISVQEELYLHLVSGSPAEMISTQCEVRTREGAWKIDQRQRG